MKAFSALYSNGHDTLANDLEGLCESRNVSGGGTMAVSSAYLEVVAVKR